MKHTLYTQSQLNACCLHIARNWQKASADGKPLVVTTKPKDEKRRTIQNARYWAMLNDFVRYAGDAGMTHSADVWHEHFKRTFIGVEDLPSGQVMGKSSTALTVKDFGDFMSRVEAHLNSEFGFVFYDRGDER